MFILKILFAPLSLILILEKHNVFEKEAVKCLF